MHKPALQRKRRQLSEKVTCFIFETLHVHAQTHIYFSQQRSCFLTSPSVCLHTTMTVSKWCQTRGIASGVCEEGGVCDISLAHISLFCCICPFLIVLPVIQCYDRCVSFTCHFMWCSHYQSWPIYFFVSSVRASDLEFTFHARADMRFLPFSSLTSPRLFSIALSIYLSVHEARRRSEADKKYIPVKDRSG